MFTVLNLLTFDRAKSRYMAIGDLCSGAWTDYVAADAPFPPSRSFAHVKEAPTDTLHNAYALEHAMIV